MNLLDWLNQMVEDLDTLIRATSDPTQQSQLTRLRDAFDSMSDEAVHNLFDTASADYADAITSLDAAAKGCQAATTDLSKVAGAISTAVTAAKAVDKVIGFLAH